MTPSVNKSLAAFLVALLAGGVLSAREDPVAVASTASVAYVREKGPDGKPKPETYLFFQGRFFGGTARDPDLEHAQFTGITRTLAESMVRQNYFPSRNPKQADLLIVVHWGTTTVEEDPNQQSDLEHLNGAIADEQAGAPSMDHAAINLELAIQDLKSNSAQNSVAFNARLLGFQRELVKDQNELTARPSGMSDDELELQHLLGEERYFVILMAYDFPTMKQGVKPLLLWSTRFSIRSPGNSFTRSLPAMSRAAADYFGKALDQPVIGVPPTPEGKVEIGPQRVIENGK